MTSPTVALVLLLITGDHMELAVRYDTAKECIDAGIEIMQSDDAIERFACVDYAAMRCGEVARGTGHITSKICTAGSP
jgi:hypothetical protein